MARGTLIVLSAPSGTGKSSLVHRLLQDAADLVFSVSATTREPRAGETDGVDYRFLSRDEFDRRVAAGEMLEHAEVHGNGYGTLRGPIDEELRAGRDVLLDIDVQGAAQVVRSGIASHLVFILPPSREELEQRLRLRGLDSEETIALRLRNAADEVRQAPLFDSVLVNDDLDETVRGLQTVVRALRRSREAMADEIAAIAASFGITPAKAWP